MTDHNMRRIQSAINIDQPGCTVAGYAVISGLQRLDEAHGIESAVEFYTPDGQPDYTTKGAPIQGDRLRTTALYWSSTILLGLAVAGRFGLYPTIRVAPQR